MPLDTVMALLFCSDFIINWNINCLILGQSWWKKLGDNSRDVMDVLETKDMAEIKNVADEFDVEVLRYHLKCFVFIYSRILKRHLIIIIN